MDKRQTGRQAKRKTEKKEKRRVKSDFSFSLCPFFKRSKIKMDTELDSIV